MASANLARPERFSAANRSKSDVGGRLRASTISANTCMDFHRFLHHKLNEVGIGVEHHDALLQQRLNREVLRVGGQQRGRSDRHGSRGVNVASGSLPGISHTRR